MVKDHPEQPPVGTEMWSNRPAVILSNNVIGNHSGFVQVVYLTTSARKRSGPTHILIPDLRPNDKPGARETIALCEQIHTVDVSRLGRRLGEVNPSKMRDIDQAVALSLSLGRNPNTSSIFKKWESYIQLHGIEMAAEIQALAGHTTDQRVEALTRALALTSKERDSYRSLYEASQELPAALRDVAEHTQNKEAAAQITELEEEQDASNATQQTQEQLSGS